MIKSKNFNTFLLLATFLIYAAADGAWQEADDLLGNEKFLEGLTGTYFTTAYLTRCAATGTAQAIAGYLANCLPVYFEITDRWRCWDIFNSFMTGFIWLPLVDAGNFLGGGLTMDGDPITLGRLATTSSTLAIGNYLSLSLSNRLKRHTQNTRAEDEKKEEKSSSKLADSASAVGFYLEGVAPLPKSKSGIGNVLWASLFGAIGATVGQVVHQCIGKCRSRRLS